MAGAGLLLSRQLHRGSDKVSRRVAPIAQAGTRSFAPEELVLERLVRCDAPVRVKLQQLQMRSRCQLQLHTRPSGAHDTQEVCADGVVAMPEHQLMHKCPPAILLS